MALKNLKKKKTTLKPAAVTKPVPIIVSVAGGPKVLVEALTRDEAFEKYKTVCGINATDHQPKFERPGEDTFVNEHGIVVKQTGEPIFSDLKQVKHEGEWLPDEGSTTDDGGDEEIE